MEHWNAYAEFNRDLNTLRSYRRFRDQVQNMTTIYGNGKNLWDKFNDVCQMATGAYKPKGDGIEKAILSVAQGVTAAKVAYRQFTALKQFASLPAYIPYVRADYLVKSMARPDVSELHSISYFIEWSINALLYHTLIFLLVKSITTAFFCP